MNTSINTSIDLERRTFVLEVDKRRGDDESGFVAASLSSELPVDRGGNDEVLVHTDDAVDLRRAKDGLPLLFNHDASEPIGIVERVRVVERRLVGRLRFGKSGRARDVEQDVRDGILKNVSIGYQIHRAEPSEDSVFRVTRWEPYEASVVGVPADHSVGIGRAFSTTKGKTKMSEQTHIENRSSQNSGDGESLPRSSNTDIGEIVALGRVHNCMDQAQQAISEGTSLNRFRNIVLDRIRDSHPAEPMDNSWDMGGSRESRHFANYSITKVINAMIDKDWGSAGYEREVSQELAKRTGRQPQGILVPHEALVTRDITVAGAPGLVGTDHLAGDFIDRLRQETMVLQLGARVLSGLQGNVSIPRRTGSVTTAWVAEGAAAAESDSTFDAVTMAPSTISANTTYSRKMLLQSSPAIEGLVRDDLREEIAIALDKAALAGSGAGAEPEGILNASGIGAIEIATNGGAIAWANVVDLAKEVALDNAHAGNLAYVTNHAVAAKMRQTPRQSSGVEGNFMLPAEVTDQLAGYRLGVTNNVPSTLTKGTGTNLSAMILGNWRDLLIGLWSTVDIIVDPYTESTTGNVRVTAMQDADIALRHAESFAVVDDIDTA